jgi:ABC-type polysaccharide/polyol phosphate transport system ATPase subunit
MNRPAHAIEVINLHKTFMLSHQGPASFKAMVLQNRHKPTVEPFEVLKGITFNVNWGEGVAIVGRNGAGKSTLLSLLSRVIRPTSGTLRVNGHVAPLLELGSGFIQDLSGLDNIFFNAIMLGMTRQQVEERLDSIVEFSELRRHIDAPVRTYSSGMMSRLGYAIAAHVNADIMIVDEALSVGDFAFQSKCLTHLKEFRARGGTTLFVSHSAEAVLQVAERCILLSGGRIMAQGPPEEIMERYREHDAVQDVNRL